MYDSFVAKLLIKKLRQQSLCQMQISINEAIRERKPWQEVMVAIQSKRVEIYNVELHINANAKGLMHN